MQVGIGEDVPQTLDIAVEMALAAGFDQQSAQPGRCQLGRLCRGGRSSQDGAGIGAGQPAVGQPGEGHQGGRVEVFEQVADLVADLLARPHGVLLGAGQHSDSLGQLGVGGQRAMRASISAHDVGQQAPHQWHRTSRPTPHTVPDTARRQAG